MDVDLGVDHEEEVRCTDENNNKTSSEDALTDDNNDSTTRPRCYVCDRTFASAKSLKRHVKMHSSKEYPCSLCEKKFYASEYLNAHMKTHGEKHVCEECGSTYATLPYLRRHIDEKHRKIYKYICPDCGRGCCKASRLKEHMRRHTGEKPFSCELCGKRFYSQDSMKGHLKSRSCAQSQKKVVECVVCKKTFKSNKYLKQHQNTHSEQNYICEHCGKKISWKNCLKLHLKKCSL